MPKEIISHIEKRDELHFIITGSKNHKPYKVEIVNEGNKKLINSNLSGITAARRYIAYYVHKHGDSLIHNTTKTTVIND